MPLAVAAITLGLLDIPHEWALAAILTAGLPTGITVVIFSGRVKATPGFGSSIFFSSTVLSSATIPVLVALLARSGKASRLGLIMLSILEFETE
ncbi:hypothetical protein [uncultured Cohaesibacter sp.]|uniref:hypothetical protein n=1 Tax=uncultured Cohaesibacter sp. TaxID=1002546 RepID=UPI0029C83063|nr:hypothetical protein [uncultured Cohaesibacter sp.]